MIIFLVAALGTAGSGLALLALLRLRVGVLPADLALGWLLGAGYFALAVAALRFLGGVPYVAPLVAPVLVAPPLLLAVLRHRFARPAAPQADPRPAPRALLIPVIAYVVLAFVWVALHGFNTPTHTDDGVRVRALAPLLALDDTWASDERLTFVMAGAVPTFVPTIALRLTGAADHFQINYVVLVDLLALLVLLVSTAVARGRPARGWLSAFAVLSLPLFLYHCTSTYAEAILAIYLGAALVFLLQLDEHGDPADAARALLLLTVGAMVKREGELVVMPVALVVLACAARRLSVNRAARLALFLLPYSLYVAVKLAAVGAAQTFPFLPIFASRAAQSAPAVTAAPVAADSSGAPRMFVYALFESGNAGLVFFVLLPTAALAIGRLRRRGHGWALLAVAVLFAEAAVSSLWLVPRFTIDQSTVHRALLPVSVAAALWIAAFLYDTATAPRPD